MIVELFGPPGSGKTTFCHQLAQDLRSRGYVVELALSRRPAEPPVRRRSTLDQQMARHALSVFPRVVRPAMELVYLSLAPQRWPGCLHCVGTFGRLLPQTSLLGGIRLAQYLIRLYSAWRRAETSSHVVIYDQAFVQAVASAALNSRVCNPQRVETALDLVPRADLLIEIEASPRLLHARIAERLRKQGQWERMLERDTRPTTRNVQLFRTIAGLLGRAGDRPLITVLANDPGSIVRALEEARGRIAEAMARASSPAGQAEADRAVDRSRSSQPTIGRGLIAMAAGALALVTLQLIAPAHPLAQPQAQPTRHFASGDNFGDDGRFLPSDHGFDLADVASPGQLAALHGGVKALVWVGLCRGADETFRQKVAPFLGDPRVFGFYLMDDPDPLGRWQPPCRPEHLQAEVDWIKLHDADAKTFVALMNMGSSAAPSYTGSYSPQNSHVDLFGIGAYPCRSEQSAGCDLDMIDRFVEAALRWGIPRERIVPVYQTFGAGEWRDDRGGRYAIPTARETEDMLDRWARLIPSPVFDYAYSWGSQRDDRSLASAPDLLGVVKAHNQRLVPSRDAGAPASDSLSQAVWTR